MNSAPRFLGLTQTAFGVLGSWGDGAGGVRVAVLENASARESGGGAIVYRFRPIALVDFPAVFAPGGAVVFTSDPVPAVTFSMTDLRDALIPVADLPEPSTP